MTNRGKGSTRNSWRAMLDRCGNPKHMNFPLYGGRGIRVCKEWLVYEAFLRDMGERPIGKTLDRIDPDGHYEPGNCRWATQREQMANLRPQVYKNSRKTHCPAGHPYEGPNLTVRSNSTHRHCRTCELSQARARNTPRSPQDVECPQCGRSFAGTRGLKLHQRHVRDATSAFERDLLCKVSA